MTSNRPYLIRAVYEWIVDNNMTPYLLADTARDNVQVPMDFVDDQGRIILNVSPMATRDLELGNHEVTFSARFSGKTMYIVVPVNAVMAVYAKENGKGMMFGPEEDGDDTPPPSKDPDGEGSSSGDKKPAGAKRPALKVVK